ncbi:TetR/AcrR family transcriptional regulator [Amycolatopsis sp. CA-230715]|uniref:TetR/AcrR family transcriptional regulator n=1 Tax=Amycolatopsis sp. CA-230715 TaxID=2745196 RepID=UPI001C0102EC|nr:TetR/AcrR family transcriptional regulator [Amycolatopsis sp. CA-230715]QWF82051.1 hypothetical protein HUW46_05488 [Amycolatopsis sp. CA-230715]
MPRTSERGGPRTRARILEVSNRMFIEHGYDAVTVSDVAREAGVSSVTVFNHFPRKEDLFLDRAAEAADLLRSAIRDREPAVDALKSLRDLCFRLADDRHPLSGLADGSAPFFRTIADSPALVAHARTLAAELHQILAEELENDAAFEGDATLLAAFFLAGYSTVLAETARHRIAGTAPRTVRKTHRARLERLFAALDAGG